MERLEKRRGKKTSQLWRGDQPDPVEGTKDSADQMALLPSVARSGCCMEREVSDVLRRPASKGSVRRHKQGKCKGLLAKDRRCKKRTSKG